ncbi:DUF5652 family protein [Patescibacteria group bacterium]
MFMRTVYTSIFHPLWYNSIKLIMPWYLGNPYNIFQFDNDSWWLFVFFIIIWILYWKGVALWFAARRGDKIWFLLFIAVHTLGLLEIIYLLFIVRYFSDKKNRKKYSKKDKKK